MIQRVTIRANVWTFCPNGGRDHTEVAVSWKPVRHVDAERIAAMVTQLAGETLWCEELADSVAREARQLVGARVTVVARQIEGHGVEAEAVR